jgi:hypothetical protein
VQAQLLVRMLHLPAFSGPQLATARDALRACAGQADTALAGLPAGAAGLAALEAMQRFAVRTVLPFLTDGGLFHFPWLQRAVWQHCPTLAPAGMAGKLWAASGWRQALHAAALGVQLLCGPSAASPSPSPLYSPGTVASPLCRKQSCQLCFALLQGCRGTGPRQTPRQWPRRWPAWPGCMRHWRMP